MGVSACLPACQLALEKLIFRIPDLHALAWSEAKRLAMEVEGTRQAVAMRLQAFQRRKVAYRWYRGIRSKCIRIQACWRRAILHYHYQLRLTYFEEDRCIRIRHVSALRIQTAYRVFRARRTYLRLIEVREAANRCVITLPDRWMDGCYVTTASLTRDATAFQGAPGGPPCPAAREAAHPSDGDALPLVAHLRRHVHAHPDPEEGRSAQLQELRHDHPVLHPHHAGAPHWFRTGRQARHATSRRAHDSPRTLPTND